MTTDELLDQQDTFVERLRDGLDHIAHANPVSEPGVFDPDLWVIANDDNPQPSRTATTQALRAAAAVIAVVGGLLAPCLTMRDSSPAMSNQPAQPPITTNETAPPETAPTTDTRKR